MLSPKKVGKKGVKKYKKNRDGQAFGFFDCVTYYTIEIAKGSPFF